MAGLLQASGPSRLAVDELAADCLHADVDQVADVGDAVAADPADLLVGEAVLELQPDDLRWLEGRVSSSVEDPRGRLARSATSGAPGRG